MDEMNLSTRKPQEASMVNEIATFAARFNVSVADAYKLPAVFEVAARKVGMPVRALIATATYSNQALGQYLAGVAKTVTE
jgi:hypothetical protein